MMKPTKALYCRRSAKAPVMSSGVITANIVWKSAKSAAGISSSSSSPCVHETSLMKGKVAGEPRTPPIVSPKQRLKPMTNQSTVSRIRPERHCIRRETVAEEGSRPASKRPSAGVITASAAGRRRGWGAPHISCVC